MLTVIHIWTCDFCPTAIASSRNKIQRGLTSGMHVIDHGDVPNDCWHWIEGKLACPRHEVIVKDKAVPK